ncbi:MAG: sensor histidine kinase, partial [Thermoplasmata archaeon]|nr:sensor histidine kinase [Thermoplasmata archaeon]
QLERVPRLEIKQDIQEISLDVDISLSLGLIINELVTNSLKHGFLNVNIEEPSIKIILREEGENLILQVSDNGKGMSPNINFRDTESLGLQLVNTLADELEGKLTLEKEQGTKFILIFSKEAGK